MGDIDRLRAENADCTDQGSRGVGEGGFGIVWPGDLDAEADRLYEMTLEQNGPSSSAAFIHWRWQNKLSLSRFGRDAGWRLSKTTGA